MKMKKLIINTKTQKYPLIIGTNLSSNTSTLINKNSIKFKKCLLVIDKKVPKIMINRIKKSLKKKKYLFILFKLMKKIKIKKILI